MSEIVQTGVLRAGLPAVASGQLSLFLDTTDVADPPIPRLKTSAGAFKTLATSPTTRDFWGTAYIDTTNSQGWTGADVGAWINAAYAYLKTTYGTAFGGIIQIAPGTYSFTTPIVIALTGFSIILRGSGDGNAGTQLVYTATTGVALTVGGGSGNNGGAQLEDFTLNGTSASNATTGVFWGVNPTSSISGATMKNVALNLFGTGESMLSNGQAYAIEHINVKIQGCTTGYTPFQENNVWFGGLIGGCATGMSCSASVEVQMFGTAFDDNTTNAISCTNALVRITLGGCRFENPSLTTTSQYINLTAGSINMNGGGFQEDNSTGGPATGFVQGSGGTIAITNTWLFSNGRVLTQAFNLSGTVLAHIDPIIAPTSTGITTLFTAGYVGAPRRLDWTRISNVNTAAQSIVLTAASPGTYLTSSNLNVPNPVAGTNLAVGARFQWRVSMTKSAAGTNTTSIIIFGGTNGTTADTVLATLVITGAGTAAVDTLQLDVVLTVNAAGATGTAFWSIVPTHVAAAATGFGTPVSAGLSGTTAAFNFNTAGLKFGLGVFGSATGATYTVVQVEAQAFNVD